MPATPATDREPSPCPPCRCNFIGLGRGGVSRPIEGLDSFGAVRTLRMRRTPASAADASRPRNSRDRLASALDSREERQRGARCCITQQRAWDQVLPFCLAATFISSRVAGWPGGRVQDATPDPCTQARSGPVRAQIQSSQRSAGAQAVEALDGPRHARSSQTNQVAAAGWAGAWLAVRCRRGGHVRVGWRAPGAAQPRSTQAIFGARPPNQAVQARVQPRM